jgi:hypothetical protein
LTAVVGGMGVGIVVGWLLPIVQRRSWQSVVASAAIVGIVAGALYLLAGIEGSLGGAIGVAGGAWLHAAFLEHVARRIVITKEA